MMARSERDRPAIAFFRRRDAAAAIGLEAQQAVVERFAARLGYAIGFVFVHTGAPDAEPFESEAFVAMLGRLADDKAATVIVASPATLSEDPLVHAVAVAQFRRHGIDLLAADAGAEGPITSSPADIADHVLDIGARLEAQLTRMASRRTGRFGPRRRKNYVEMFPAAVALAKALHEQNRRRGVRVSLRELSATLAQRGHFNNAGKAFHPDEVRRMIKGPAPAAAAWMPAAPQRSHETLFAGERVAPL